MTKDLEETLNGMPLGYREVVARLKASAEVVPVKRRSLHVPLLMAAGFIAVFLGLSIIFNAMRPIGTEGTQQRGPREYVLSAQTGLEAALEIVRTQKTDGSWQNDYLTRRYIAVLKDCPDARVQLAYRRALRNLRVRGLR